MEAKKSASAQRAEVKGLAVAQRAEAKKFAAAQRAKTKAASVQVKDDKRAAKVAAAEAQEAVIHAFSVGALTEYVAENGLPEGLSGWAEVDGRLASAFEHAKAGRIEREETSIRAALTAAKTHGGRAMRKMTEQRITATTGRLLRLGSSYVGRVLAEDGFSQAGRKGKLLAVTTAEKWCEIRSDRVITPTKAYPIDANTTAQVYLDGQALITQRPTLTRMVLLSPLPGSAIIPGMALQKKEKVDLRQGEFQVGGLGWSMRVIVHPDKMSTPRQMAEQINRHANDIANRSQPAPAPEPAVVAPRTPAGDDVLSRLERLKALVESGAITQAEAEAIKQEILGR